MKLSLILLVFLFFGCGRASNIMDNYCTEQCSNLFERYVEGIWHGNDLDWNKTRCYCYNDDFGSGHLFDLMEK